MLVIYASAKNSNTTTIIQPLKHLFHYIPTLIVAAVIAYLSLIREIHISYLSTFVGWDKIVHFTMFFGLAATMYLDNRRSGKLSRRTRLIICIICILYGGLIEILQETFFYPRTGDWLDWISDCIGTLIGIFLAHKIWIHRKKSTTC